jgi:hypothetical protein
MRRRGVILLASIAAASLCGCAYVENRPDGSQRVIGLGYWESPGPSTQTSGQRSRFRTLGVSFMHAGDEFTATVGYADSTLTLVNGNSCVAFIGERQ